MSAGDVVTVRWSGLPDDVEELEFLLQRDDGDVVRLTEQLSPMGDSFQWIVPSLPSRRARLVLRAGIEGRELTLATSEPFAIRGAASGAHLKFRNGEWWTIELPPPSPEPSQISSVLKGRAAPTLWRARRPLFVATPVDAGGGQPLETVRRTEPVVNTRAGAPLSVPQRK